METKPCVNCGDPIHRGVKQDGTTFYESPSKWDQRQFHGMKCRDQNRRKSYYQFVEQHPRWCEYCEERITPPDSRKGLRRRSWLARRWCNPTCRDAWHEREWELDLHDIRHLVTFNVYPENIAKRMGFANIDVIRAKLQDNGELGLADHFRVREETL